MAHNGNDPFDGLGDDLRAHFEDKLGPTGRHPEGKLTPNDQGEIQLAVGVTSGKVVLGFGTYISWIGMPPKGARDLAKLLIENAIKAEGH